MQDHDDTVSAPLTDSPAPNRRHPPDVTALRLHPTGALHELPEGERTSLGTGPGCRIVLDDPYVSRVHCVLERSGHRVLVRDRWSKNGTYLNGHRVEAAELRPGSVLVVGQTRLTAIGTGQGREPTALELLLGEEPSFRETVELALRAAATDCSVLILGETGTGKDLLARAIHESSPRSARPYVALNCGGIPQTLVASELFGHVRGAFTGATSDKRGVFVEAEGGTLFLDELGELPLTEQPHLLRALENRAVRPVGGTTERPIDVRLVSATNRLDLKPGGGTLRPDLYHRVATVVLEVPPLRARRRDIPLLVRAFMREAEPRYGTRDIDESAMRALVEYPWPGNVRELRHAVQRAVALSDRDLSLDLLLPQACSPALATAVEQTLLRDRTRLKAGEGPTWLLTAASATYDEVIRQLMEAALERHGSIRRAAAALGIPKSTFADRARRLGIDTSPKRGE